MAGMGEKVMVGVGIYLWLLLMAGTITSVRGTSEDCSIELYDKIFNPTLESTRAPWALVEFFASWCPTCQKYKPQYDRVACIFNDPNAIHGDEVYITRVDCGIESNKMLCERFAIQHYPTLYWGPPKKLAAGGGAPKAKLGLESTSAIHVLTANDLLEWINQRIDKNYTLTDAMVKSNPQKVVPAEHASDNLQRIPGDEMLRIPPGCDLHTICDTKNKPLVFTAHGYECNMYHFVEKMPATLHDIEEATARAFDFMMDEKMMRSTSRGSFLQFLHLLDVHHPSERCRRGSAELLINLDKLWPMRQPPTAALRRRQLCGAGLPRGYWKSCAGENHGYSCGLWMLFHSLTVQVEDFESSFARSAIEAFVSDFMKCEECRDHFLNTTSRTSLDSSFMKKDVVIWLWRAHNKVTDHIAQKESRMKGKTPRRIWPPENECPACRDSSTDDTDWDEEAVYYFLMEWYGPLMKGSETSQQSDLKLVMDNADNLLGVSSWTAAGVALASCGFGLTTWYWRFHQKKLKFSQRRF